MPTYNPTRRAFLGGGAAMAAAVTAGALTSAAAEAGIAQRAACESVLRPSITGLKPITSAAAPISAAERQARIDKLQALMLERKVAAFLVESGSTLEYFTGIVWRRSERTTAAIIPARGAVLVVTPAFEEPSVRETLQVAGDVRPWDEPENPFDKIVQGLQERGIGSGDSRAGGSAAAVVAVEPTLRFFIVDGVRQAGAAAKNGGYEWVSGDALVRACRMIKSPAELALLQTANDVTLQALSYVHAHVARGMVPHEIAGMMDDATAALGGNPEFSMVLLNEATAYPHGSKQPQTLGDGSVILMDCGCTVHGYQSDISRTWVFGQASAKQRKLWDTVKRGQEMALQTARLGAPVGTIDDAVRHYYESQGWGPGYRLPGLSHRTGHGIGLDGHESAYLVHGDATPLQPGMCFSDEPGIYIPGEFGVRLEDCWYMTASGPKTFTRLAQSLEQPI